MILFIGSDHAGFEYKTELFKFLEELSVNAEDLGTNSGESVHYPDFASKLALKVRETEGALGILICASGIGVSMVANRYKKIRAARCLTEEDAKMSRLHNNSNVLCLASRMTTLDNAKQIIKTWLETEFEGGRHQERVSLFDSLGS